MQGATYDSQIVQRLDYEEVGATLVDETTMGRQIRIRSAASCVASFGGDEILFMLLKRGEADASERACLSKEATAITTAKLLDVEERHAIAEEDLAMQGEECESLRFA